MALTAIDVIHSKPMAADRRVKLVDTAIIPNSVQQVIAGDAEVLAVILVNYGAQANPKISLTDGNGQDWCLTLTPISSGFPVTVEYPEGLHATGGLSWVCDTASAVKGKVVYRRG